MRLRPIRNDQDYEKTLELIDTLRAAKEGSYEQDLLDILVELIENYEKKRWGTHFPDPIEAIKFYMIQKDKSLNDLADLFDSTELATRLLEKKSPITISMIYRLCMTWNIPAEALIKPYPISSD